MRKSSTIYNSIAILAFILGIFGPGRVEAYYDAGCTGAGPYSVISGMLCDNSQYSQYPTQYPQSTYTTITELGLGSRGQDVLVLQQSLSGRGYSVGRADGIFGSRTRRAVISYQTYAGLPVTGVADVQTLTSLNLVNSYNPYTPYTTPTCPIVIVNGVTTSNCGGYNGYTTIPTISGVSGPQALAVNQQGTWTLTASSQNGGNLSYSVNWGDQVAVPMYLNNNSAYLPQQSATFNHSYLQAGTYTPVFTVTNPSGQTAQTSLTVNVGGSVYNSGLVITTTTLPNASYGVNYSATLQAAGGTGSYTWSLNSGSLPPGLYLNQAQCFTYPCQALATISGTPTISSGTYSFQVSLFDGVSRIYQNFTIYIYGGTSQTPNISYLSPTSGLPGTQVTIYGSGFGYNNNCGLYSCGNVASQPMTVNFGGNVIQNVYSYNGTSLTFTVPSYTSPACLYSYPACAIAQTRIIPGTYPISITNNYGTSNAVSFTVTGYAY